MKQRVIVIGHGFTSRLSIIRSVGVLGCDVTVISLTWYKNKRKELNKEKQIDCYSKYVSKVLYCYRRGEQELLDLLLNECIESDHKPIIIPDTDFSAATVDKYKELLSPYFLFPQVKTGFGSVREWMDKLKQKQLAREIGLNVSDSYTIVEIRERQYTIPQSIKYPCFTKPLSTIVGGKGGMHKCDNEEELILALDELKKHEPNARVLIEAFMNIEREYAVLGFSDGNEVIIPGAIQQLIVSKKNKGIAMTGKVMPVAEFADLIDKFKQFVLATGFIGIFDIDFFLSGGKYYFCEMNLRFGGSGYAITKMGVNLPAMLVRSLRGESITDMQQSFSETATYVNERMCMDDWLSTFITFDQLEEYINKADISFLQDKNDMAPYKQYQRRISVLRIKKFIKIWLKRIKLR